MRPYYDADGITIYHGDSRAIMAEITAAHGVGCIISDPPYGIRYKPLRGSNGSKMWGKEVVTGDADPFDPAAIVALGLPTILWGANHYASRLPDSGGWLVWDKTPRGIREGFIYSHCELAWTNVFSRVAKFALEWQGADRNGEGHHRPTQKPVGLMEWCHRFVPSDAIVLDPFMGSGGTLLAAARLGRRCIGIEVEEKYCATAVRRLAQKGMDLV
jgi:hypothetical protein